MTRQYNSYGRDQYNIETFQFLRSPDPARSRDEQTLLKAVGQEIHSRLAQSLHEAVLINLGKEAQPDRVKRPWEREIKIGTKPAVVLPEDRTIVQVFDDSEIGGKLLILGQPGAGKTTELLELAKTLVERAWEDVNYPLPLIFSLSNWKDSKQLIQDWLLFEMRSKYGVSSKLSQKWLSDRQILPLLDGLDEVALERQESCIHRINEFLTGESFPIYAVVCSRLAEYESHAASLQLNGAIVLNALSDKQIQTYLDQIGRAELWQFFSHSPNLLDLLRTPLLLSITLLAYLEADREQWQRLQETSARLKYLLDRYVERMLHRELRSTASTQGKAPSAKQIRLWLMWLAKQMEQASQTEFLIERMRPSWLQPENRNLYRTLVGLSFGLIFGLSGGLSAGLGAGLMGGLIFGLIGGLIGGLIFGLSDGLKEEIEIVESLKWSWQKTKIGLILGLNFGLMGGLMGGLIFGLIFGLMGGLSAGLGAGLGAGLIGGLIFGLIFGLSSGLSGELNLVGVEATTIPNQGIRNSAKNFVFVWLIVWLSFGLIGGLSFGLSSGLSLGLSLGLSFGLGTGGSACIQHFTLRILLYRNRHIPWNYARFLDGCTERLVLQRVGGGYRFIHKRLQEHFAEMQDERE
jgi:DNA polymerase III delta prime subunit